MNEPLHTSFLEAIAWVRQNTDNVIFTSKVAERPIHIRIDANSGRVMMLHKADDGHHFWESMRELI